MIVTYKKGGSNQIVVAPDNSDILARLKMANFQIISVKMSWEIEEEEEETLEDPDRWKSEYEEQIER
jgi:hypothetical protein